MKRRQFLCAGVSGATLLGWPPLLARALGPECGEGERLEQLFDAYRRARRQDKPLVVMIVPAEQEHWYSVGQLHGQALEHGDDATLAALAQTVLVAATRAELARLVELPEGEDADSRSLRVVGVDSSVRPARVHEYGLDLPPEPDAAPRRRATEYDEVVRAENARVDREIAAVGALYRQVVQALLPDAPPLVAEAEALARAVRRGEDIDGRVALRWARALHAHALRAPEPELLQALARAMRAALREPVTGSAWAQSHGCGVQVEGASDEGFAIGCGMGHVPEKSVRFLYFYTRQEP